MKHGNNPPFWAVIYQQYLSLADSYENTVLFIHSIGNRTVIINYHPQDSAYLIFLTYKAESLASPGHCKTIT